MRMCAHVFVYMKYMYSPRPKLRTKSDDDDFSVCECVSASKSVCLFYDEIVIPVFNLLKSNNAVTFLSKFS